MSFYAYDVNGYVGDVASVGGLRQFASWARSLGGAAEKFVDEGYTHDPAALQKQLSTAKATGDDETVRENLAKLAGKAEECLILSDGEENG